MQDLFEKLMTLMRTARADYRRLTSNVVQAASQSQLPVRQQCLQADSDLVTTRLSQWSLQRNGLTVVHSSDKNCSVQSTNGLQEHIVETICSTSQSPS